MDRHDEIDEFNDPTRGSRGFVHDSLCDEFTEKVDELFIPWRKTFGNGSVIAQAAMSMRHKELYPLLVESLRQKKDLVSPVMPKEMLPLNIPEGAIW